MTLDRLTAVVRELVEAANTVGSYTTNEGASHAMKAKALFDGLEGEEELSPDDIPSVDEMRDLVSGGLDASAIAPTRYPRFGDVSDERLAEIAEFYRRFPQADGGPTYQDKVALVTEVIVRRAEDRAKPAPSDYEPSPPRYASGEVPMVGDVVLYLSGQGVTIVKVLPLVGTTQWQDCNGLQMTAPFCQYKLLQRAPKPNSEADYEPSEAMVEAACREYFTAFPLLKHNHYEAMRAALKAAHAVGEKP